MLIKEEVFIINNLGFKDFVLERDNGMRLYSGTNVIKDSQNIHFNKRRDPTQNTNGIANADQSNIKNQ